MIEINQTEISQQLTFQIRKLIIRMSQNLQIMSHSQSASPIFESKGSESCFDNKYKLGSKKSLINLSMSVKQYQKNLNAIQSVIEDELTKNQSIKYKCSNSLKNNLSQLKEKFLQFSNQWKIQLPFVCQQFMDIVSKICSLYQQEVQRLSQLNQKWQFSYNQLLKSTKNDKISNLQSSDQSTGLNASQFKNFQILDFHKETKDKLERERFSQTFSSYSNLSQKLSIDFEEKMKYKDEYFPQCSLMREQITELFEQENSSFLCEKEKKKSSKDLQEGNQTHKSIWQWREKNKVKQLGSSLNLTDIGNILKNNSNSVETKDRFNAGKKAANQEKSGSSIKKNSISSKDQFWQSLQANISSSNKSNKSLKNKSRQKQNTKDKISFTIKQIDFQKDCLKEKSKQRKQDEPHIQIGNKFQELKKTLFKNKNLADYRY